MGNRVIAPAEAKRWAKLLRESLTTLKQIAPLGAKIGELPISKLTESSRWRIMMRAVKSGYVRYTGQRYFANVDKVSEALKSDQAISNILWPKKTPTLPQLTEEKTIGELLEEPALQSQLALPPPPPIENLQRPPEGASMDVVVQWVFTLLHAQTENLIYVREQVDQLASVGDRLKSIADLEQRLKSLVENSTKILESLR